MAKSENQGCSGGAHGKGVKRRNLMAYYLFLMI
jgi:hypothetical protein